MSKQIKMSARPQPKPNADTWVETRADLPPPPKVKPKRLTIDIDPALHTRLKLHCVQQDVRIADFLRELIHGALEDNTSPSEPQNHAASE